MSTKKISIIGAGAAGCFAAISAREKNPNAEIIIYEASKKALSKVLISGGGRCNVTTSTREMNALVENYPRGKKELKSVFSRFSVDETIDWFEKNGVKLKTEADGRMFPITNKSQTVVDSLLSKIKNSNIKIKYNHKAIGIKKDSKNNFQISFLNNEKIVSNVVILTTGGNREGYKIFQSLNHNIIPPMPSLFTFEINDKRLESLAGISFSKVKLTLNVAKNKKYEQVGPLLITHWGLSAPSVIKLSAYAARDLFDLNYCTELNVNFIPEFKFDLLREQLNERKNALPRKVVSKDSFLGIPKRYWGRLVQGIAKNMESTWAEFSKRNIESLVEELSAAKFKITGKGKFKEEFVTAGGVPLKEVDLKTMESKICSKLFFAGEILDIDGITGGYNFQSAWSTGWIAGQNV